LILDGAIFGSRYPQEHKDRVEAKKGQKTEFQIAASFITDLLPQDKIEKVRLQAQQLNDQASRDKTIFEARRKLEYEERRQLQREEDAKQKDVLRPRDAQGAYKERAPKEPKPVEVPAEKAPVQKKKIVLNEDGFRTQTTEVFDGETGKKIKEVTKKGDAKGNLTTIVKLYEEDGKVQTVEIKNPDKAKTTNTKGPQTVSQSLLAANPFSAVNKQHLFESPDEIQAKFSQAKAGGQANANEKGKKKGGDGGNQPNSGKARGQAAAPAAQKPATPNKAVTKQNTVESAKQKKEAEEAEKLRQKEERERKAKEAAERKKRDREISLAKQPNKKALANANKKSVPFWEDQKTQPLVLGLGIVVVVLALAYAFVVTGSA